ncbi:MAG: hypothetical protein Q9O62_02960 [Ardenticatenia bacterium]|nr:hypothetical protein [Ardenticatenia bacterium]
MRDTELPRILWTPPEERAESDCACPGTDASLPGLDLPEAKATSAEWEVVPELYHAPLPDGHQLVFNPWGRAGVVVLNRPAVALLEGFRHPHQLDSEPARQMAALELLQPAGQGRTRPATATSVLTAWLHVTNACNLRCTYCYVAKTHEAMDEATGLAAVARHFSRGPAPRLPGRQAQICWRRAHPQRSSGDPAARARPASGRPARSGPARRGALQRRGPFPPPARLAA